MSDLFDNAIKVLIQDAKLKIGIGTVTCIFNAMQTRQKHDVSQVTSEVLAPKFYCEACPRVPRDIMAI